MCRHDLSSKQEEVTARQWHRNQRISELHSVLGWVGAPYSKTAAKPSPAGLSLPSLLPSFPITAPSPFSWEHPQLPSVCHLPIFWVPLRGHRMAPWLAMGSSGTWMAY